MKDGGYGLVGDPLLGIIGAMVGGFLSSTLLGVDGHGLQRHKPHHRSCQRVHRDCDLAHVHREKTTLVALH
jgi:hypothetical protein